MERFEAEVTVRRTRFASAQTGWAVVEAAEGDGTPVVLVGPLVHLEERERVRISGEWVNDERYGPQIKVAEAVPIAPTDTDTLSAYLCRIRHVGPKRAAKLIERYGPQVIDAVDADPSGTFATLGLRPKAAGEATRAWERLRVTRRLHLMLAPHGLGYLAVRIHQELGDGAHRVVSERPYELTSVFGVGFVLADRIARGLGIGPDDPGRARAGTIHLLSEAERGGSTCLPREELERSLAELLGAGFPAELIESLAAAGELAIDDRWVYRRVTAELESELAERVHELTSAPPSPRLERARRSEAEGAGPGAGLELTAQQLTGLSHAFEHRLSLITGGPGTGKTASIKTIAARARAGGARVMLVAPTGRAAVRMHESSGFPAKTVHSALGWVPGEGPAHDEQDPLGCELLIVDETSMANLELLVTLLRAVGPDTHVVLVGDADQLAPVGAGKPFAELVAGGVVPAVSLDHIFRQAAGSMIVQAAHRIRRGEMADFRPAEGMRRDLFLIERDDPLQARAEIVSLVSERLPAHYGVDPVRDIQVFAPVYRGEVGIDALNLALREALNPDGRPIRGGRLRLGDKLMLTGRNLHDLGLMNGTLLRLLDEVAGGERDEAALILSAEEAIFRLPPEETDRLRLAYACSVHRGQGIELPVAVIVAHPAGGAFFLRREMLYTAVTRARLATVIVGTRETVARAARTPDTSRRYSRLGERLARL